MVPDLVRFMREHTNTCVNGHQFLYEGVPKAVADVSRLRIFMDNMRFKLE